MSEKVDVRADELVLEEADLAVNGEKKQEQVIDALPPVPDEFEPELDNAIDDSINTLPSFGPGAPEATEKRTLAVQQDVPNADAAPAQQDVTEVTAEHAESHAADGNEVEMSQLPNFGPRDPGATIVPGESVPAIEPESGEVPAPKMETEVSAEHAESHSADGNDVDIAELPTFSPDREKAVINAAESQAQLPGTAPVPAAAPEAEVLPSNDGAAPKEADRAVAGFLVEHGPAKFNFDPKERVESYFVKLMADDGEQIVWGRDLKRAMKEANAKIGDPVLLADMGSEPVNIDVDVFDVSGNVIGKDKKEVFRHTWVATVSPPTLNAAPAKMTSATVPESSDAAPAKAGAAAPSSAIASALKATVGQVMAPAAGTGEAAPEKLAPKKALSEAELASVGERLNIQGGIRPEQMVSQPSAAVAAGPAMSKGQQSQMNGVNALSEGVSSLVGGAMSLAGAAGRGVGNIAHGLANAIPSRASASKAPTAEGVSEPQQTGGESIQPAGEPPIAKVEVPSVPKSPVPMPSAPVIAPGGLPAVLPRLSEYRIQRAEDSAKHFCDAQDNFWKSSEKLSAVQAELQKIAKERNLPMQDVCNLMKPGGELAELRTKFNDGLVDNPDAAKYRKAMDKAMDSYVRTFDRAQEELVNPEQKSNPHYDKLKGRLDKSHEDLEKNAAGVPAFENSKGELEPSHFEKLREAVAAIMEKVKEIIRSFIDTLRGKRGDDNAPAP